MLYIQESCWKVIIHGTQICA